MQGFPRADTCIDLETQEGVITESGISVFLGLLEQGMNFFFLKLDDPSPGLPFLQAVQGMAVSPKIAFPRGPIPEHFQIGKIEVVGRRVFIG